jgi:CBS domain-containing protein
MQVSEIMTTAVECCTPNDMAQIPAQIMKDADTGVVPVVAGENDPTLVGIVTDRDLCLGVVAAGRDPRQVHVQECMTAKVKSCRSDEDAGRVAQLMAEHQIRRLPVVDGKGGLMGIVSLSDIAERTPSSTAGETLREISEPTAEASGPRGESERSGRTQR